MTLRAVKSTLSDGRMLGLFGSMTAVPRCTTTILLSAVGCFILAKAGRIRTSGYYTSVFRSPVLIRTVFYWIRYFLYADLFTEILKYTFNHTCYRRRGFFATHGCAYRCRAIPFDRNSKPHHLQFHHALRGGHVIANYCSPRHDEERVWTEFGRGKACYSAELSVSFTYLMTQKYLFLVIRTNVGILQLQLSIVEILYYNHRLSKRQGEISYTVLE